MTIADDIAHGSSSGYVRHKCRCADCRLWKSEADREYRRKNAKALADRKRQYYETHREARLAYAAEYRKTLDRDALREYHRQWRERAYTNGRPRTQATKDRRKERDAARRDLIRAVEANYRAKNAQKRRDWEAARRARVRNADVREILNSDWRSVLHHYRWCCAYCGNTGGELTQDHVIPLARGGRHSIGNLVPACGPCNSSKNDRLLVEWGGRPKI